LKLALMNPQVYKRRQAFRDRFSLENTPARQGATAENQFRMSESLSDISPDLVLDRDAIEVARRSAFAVATHRPEDFEGMRRAGRLAAEVLDLLVPEVKPGVTTAALDRIAFEYTLDHGALPACLGYRGYRHTLCTSINHVVCHGIPSERTLKDGDILNIDVTVIVDGWHGDTSRMYYVGDVKRKAQRLAEVTYESMMRGIATVKPGATTGDIGYAIQSFAEDQERCAVVRDFCGHGVGRIFHALPNIVHYGRPGQGVVLKPGMFFTVEPMINLGGYAVKVLSDGWTAVTRDRSLSAQFEHSIGVTQDGFEIFTLSPKAWHAPPYS
jgi:methionyl aminopeptidase